MLRRPDSGRGKARRRTWRARRPKVGGSTDPGYSPQYGG